MGLGSSNLQEENHEAIQDGELEAELDRVLEMSSTVLDKLDRITQTEKIFLRSYTQIGIESKIDDWLRTSPEEQREAVSPYHQDLREQHRNEIITNMKEKIFKDYIRAYKDLQSLMRAVKKLVKRQRETQLNLLRMKPLPSYDRERYEQKLARLRFKVVSNLKKSEHLETKSIELRQDYVTMVSYIDQDYEEDCRSRVRGLIENFENH